MMLFRFSFIIIMVGCWSQINAIPFNLRTDYQDNSSSEKVMDFPSSSDESNISDDKTNISNDGLSVIDSFENALFAIDRSEKFEDKHSMNINSNLPKKKKKEKKNNFLNPKRKVPVTHSKENNKAKKSESNYRINKYKDYHDDVMMRKNDEKPVEEILEAKIPRDTNKTVPNFSAFKSNNFCNQTRLLNEDFDNANSHYLDLDEDFIVKSRANMERTHRVVHNEYVTLCWIETTTIKQDKSFDPPKSLIIRESSILFENSPLIPEEYLSCPIVDNDISYNFKDVVCNSSFSEIITEDTMLTKTMNITTFNREKDIDVQINKLIKCTMGPMTVKDIYLSSNHDKKPRQRIELTVRPILIPTKTFCNTHGDDIKIYENDTSMECFVDSSQEMNIEKDELKANTTSCVDKDCFGAEIKNKTTEPPLVADTDFTVNTESSFTLSENEIELTTNLSVVSEEINASLTNFSQNISLTEQPKVQIFNEVSNESSPGFLCTGMNCSDYVPTVAPLFDIVLSSLEKINPNDSFGNKSYESDESYDNFQLIKELKLVTPSNSVLMSNESISKEKNESHVPKSLICSLNNEKACKHSGKIENSQSLERNSQEVRHELSEESININKTEIERKNKSQETDYIIPTEYPVVVTTDATIILSESYSSYSTSTESLTNISTMEHTNITESVTHIPSKLNQEVLTHNSISTKDNESNSDDSKFISPESSSEELKLTKTQNNFRENSSSQSIEILNNQTYENESVIGNDSSEEELTESEEVLFYEKNTILNNSCVQFANCSKKDISNIFRRLPTLKFPMKNSSNHKVEENEQEDSGSCDCDEDSEEIKKCDTETGSCLDDKELPTNTINKDNKTQLSNYTSTTEASRHFNNDNETNSNQTELYLEITKSESTTVSTEMLNDIKNPIQLNNNLKETTPTESDKYEKISANKTKKGQKLALKIQVSLENLDRNEKDHPLMKVEKNYSLKELSDKIGNRNSSWPIETLTNDFDLVKDLINCTMLQKLTEEAVLEKLNITNINNQTSYENDDSNHERQRRNIGNNTITTEIANNSQSLNNMVVKECILPIIREDIKTGYQSVLTQLSRVLSTSVSKTTDDNMDPKELSNSSTIISRNRRSLSGDNDDSEELKLWANERLIPLANGGELRSITEMQIVENFEELQ